ncbi:hypothetical protein AVEN_31057-1 [Araneus ventricosus]|uniref:Uncharacterized protein n=1 Tax=Araneus ventricosus TaxID=182803 RepID=A0A4Y2GF48_ARAVE|nr:hypothetical protein AVEN_31057-1 [Araneus ventricosus]
MRQPPFLRGHCPTSEKGPMCHTTITIPTREGDPAYLSGGFSSTNSWCPPSGYPPFRKDGRGEVMIRVDDRVLWTNPADDSYKLVLDDLNFGVCCETSAGSCIRRGGFYFLMRVLIFCRLEFSKGRIDGSTENQGSFPHEVLPGAETA